MAARSGTMTRARAERPQLLPSGTGAFFLRRLAERADLALQRSANRRISAEAIARLRQDTLKEFKL